MVFLWFSYGFPMVFLWFSYGNQHETCHPNPCRSCAAASKRVQAAAASSPWPGAPSPCAPRSAPVASRRGFSYRL